MTIANNPIIRGLSSLIGNTPLFAINFTYRGSPRVLYAKAENLNMTGSIKDRMAFHILSESSLRGDLKIGDHIVEATSGNTGISFAAIGCAMGHPVTIFMPDWMSTERINLIRSLGSNIILINKEEGGFLGSIKRAEELANSSDNVFLPRQFSNNDNIGAHYTTTGPEIWWQLHFRSLRPDAFVAGVGTGGTIMGTGQFLKEKFPAIKLHPLEPANSPTLSTGSKIGKHRIQGISDEFIPDILDLDSLDEVVSVDDGDSIIMAQKLAHQLGLAVGISSGANFIGALMIQEELGIVSTVVTVFPDDNKKYLSTDLMQDEPIQDHFFSPDIELQSVRAFKRVCHTCCDPRDCLESSSNDHIENVKLPTCPRRC